MWLLRSKADPDTCHVLLCRKAYSIGRKDTDIVLLNDMSISRKHAILQAVHPEAHVMSRDKLPVLTVEDLSKLGTVVGERRLNKEKDVVHSGDVIWFGNLNADNSRFRAYYEPYIVTTSCLEAVAKKQTRQLLCQLGGHVINEWQNDCDALIMNNLSITIKAVCALICQKPIVTTTYLEDKLKALQSGAKQPSADDYLPPLAETQLNAEDVSFMHNPQRQNIFKGMRFIFLTSKQFKKMAVAVTAGGGTPVLMEEKTGGDQEDIILSPNSCVMLCEQSSQSQHLTHSTGNWVEHVLALLKTHGKRPIQECEIGYAVLFCSTKEHCNPDFINSNAGTGAPSQTASQAAGFSHLLHTQTKQQDNSISQALKPGTVEVKVESCSQRTETLAPLFQMKKNQKRDSGDEPIGSEPPEKRRNTATLAVRVKQEKLTPSKVNKTDDAVSFLPSNLLSLDEEEQKDSDEDMFASVPVKRRCKAQSTIHQPAPVPEARASDCMMAINSDLKTDKKKTDYIHCDDQIANGVASLSNRKEDKVILKSEFVSNSNVKIDDEFIDHNIKVPDVIIEEKPLIVKKPAPQPETVNSSNSTIPIKNFKKFRKVLPSGGNALPQIIGGADLEPSCLNEKQKLEEWFNEFAESGSQKKSQTDNDEIDFDNWDARTTVVRKRRK